MASFIYDNKLLFKITLISVALLGLAACGSHGDGRHPSGKPKDPTDAHLTDVKIRTEINQADVRTLEAELVI